MRESYAPAAMICSVLANIYRDSEKRHEPYTPADFMPGARTEEDEMREFAELVLSGHKFETDPDQLAEFKRQMRSSFSNVVDASGKSTVKAGEIVRTAKGQRPQ